MSTVTPGYIKGLVDVATGHVSREIFVNEAIYQQEQEQIFARAWLFVGHEGQIPASHASRSSTLVPRFAIAMTYLQVAPGPPWSMSHSAAFTSPAASYAVQ